MYFFLKEKVLGFMNIIQTLFEKINELTVEIVIKIIKFFDKIYFFLPIILIFEKKIKIHFYEQRMFPKTFLKKMFCITCNF